MTRRPAGLVLGVLAVMGLAACRGTAVTFEDSGQALGSADSRCVAVGDVDLDGDVDALVANTDSASTLWINDGTGTFARSELRLPSASCVALADLDGDGDQDAVLVNDETLTLLNDGQGGFSPRGEPLSNPGAVAVAVGDVDGDDDSDLVFAAWGHPTGRPNQIWLNAGDGRYMRSPHVVGTAVSADIALGDVDGDGDLDVLVANQADADHDPIPDELWLNDGIGAFTDSGLRLGRSCTAAVRLGDLDGDGDLDAIAANTSHAGKSDPANTVWLNDGTGQFHDSGQRLGDVYSLAIALGDLDRDGDLDAYVGNYRAADRIWLNNGAGQFVAGDQLLGSQHGAMVALADLDGDGDLDAFVANNTWQGGDGTNRVWLNER